MVFSGFVSIPRNGLILYTGTLSLGQKHECRNHWNYHPDTVAAFNHKLKNPEFRPDLSVVAIAPDGTWAGFCDGYIPKDGNQGWINPVGTRRGYRKQGVARSMLQAVMQQLKTEGMETAMLYVDAENPSGARRLYESVGFQTTHTQIAYVKDIAE